MLYRILWLTSSSNAMGPSGSQTRFQHSPSSPVGLQCHPGRRMCEEVSWQPASWCPASGGGLAKVPVGIVPLSNVWNPRLKRNSSLFEATQAQLKTKTNSTAPRSPFHPGLTTGRATEEVFLTLLPLPRLDITIVNLIWHCSSFQVDQTYHKMQSQVSIL